MRKICKGAALIFVIFLLSLLVFINFINSENKNADASLEISIGIDGTNVGAGTLNNPYALSSKEQLNRLSQLVNAGNEQYNSAYYQLQCDIVFNEVLYDGNGEIISSAEKFEQIGIANNTFKGHFNGNGYTIKGVHVDSVNASFFGFTDGAVIYNLGIVDSYFKGTDFAASIVASCTNTKIINCYSSSKISSSKSGGIAGNVLSSEIKNCYNTGAVIGTRFAGGIACNITTNSSVDNNYYLKIEAGINSGIFYKFFIKDGDDGPSCASFTSASSIIIDGKPLLAVLNDNIENLNDYNLELINWQLVDEYPSFFKMPKSSYTVSYDSTYNGGNQSTVIMEKSSGESIDFSIDSTKDGYQFLGWNTNSDAKCGLETLTIQDEDIVLYAIFSKEITIKFEDIITTTQNFTLYNKETCNVAFPYIEQKSGFIALGWRNDTLPLDKQYDCGQEISISNSVTYYAVYKKDIVIEFNTNDGSTVESQNATIYHNISGNQSSYIFNLPSAPKKLAYIFDKWKLEEETYNDNQEVTANESVIYLATYVIDDNVQYTINHFTQSLQGEYILNTSETKKGTAYENTSATFAIFDGFTPKPFEQTTINPDGSTIININYTRNSYNVVYQTHDKENYHTKTLKFEENIIHDGIDEPTQAGYIFDGWDCAYTAMPNEDISAFAKWKEGIANYTVKEYKEKSDDDDFDESCYEMKGQTNSETKALAKTPDGFTVQKFEQQTIKADSTTIIEIYYYRNRHNIVYQTHDNENYHTKTLKFEENIIHDGIDEPTLAGYIFVGWDSAYTAMPNEDISVFAKWKDGIANYTVKEYKEKSDGSFEENIEEKQGQTNSETEAIAKTLSGFTAQEFKQQIIKADGTTIIEIYYYINSYKIFYKTHHDESYIEEKELKFGQGIDKSTHEDIIAPKRTGYTFDGWDCDDKAMPSENITIFVIWKASIVKYNVIESEERLDGSFKQLPILGQKGETGSYTTVQARQYDGFTAQEIEQQTINADGTTIVKIYYCRNSYKVIYQTFDNLSFHKATFKYQEKIPDQDITNPIRAGYSFISWLNLPQEMPSNDVNVVAKFELNSPIITSKQQVLNKVFDGEKLCVSFNVSHELENISYKWYKDDKIVCENEVLELINACESGKYYLVATVKVDGEEPKSATSQEISVNISKKKIDMSKVYFENKQVYCDACTHEITVSGNLNTNVKVTYENNSGTEIGEYKAIAHFTVSENYEKLEDMAAVLKILPPKAQEKAEEPIENPIEDEQADEEKDNAPPSYANENRVVITSEELSKETLNLKISSYTINMEKQAFDSLKSKADSSPVAVVLNKVEKESLQLKASNLSLPNYSQIYNLALFVGDDFVDFNGAVEISVPYTLQANEKVADIKVWNIENDTLNLVDNAKYENGFVTFIAESVKYFVVGRGQDNLPTIENETLLITGAVSTICLIILAMVIIKSVRKKKKA